MTDQNFLIKILAKIEHDPSFALNLETFSELDAYESAQLFLNVIYLKTSLKFISESHWLETQVNKNKTVDMGSLISDLFQSELSPISFLQKSVERYNLQQCNTIEKFCFEIEAPLINWITSKSFEIKKIFASECLRRMTQIFVFEENLNIYKKNLNLHLGFSLYNSFNSLDILFELKYEADKGMKISKAHDERLYEGAGIGVQSGYSSVLLALEFLNPLTGCRFIDLGSGYGKVGFIIGLIRPDIRFTGFEFVEHRTLSSVAGIKKFGLESHVHFKTQDLSSKTFRIPEAEVYYMYDPFSESTYLHVVKQLIDISRKKQISIISKGGSKTWFQSLIQSNGWTLIQEFDNSNICIFRSNNLTKS